jgi:ADP-heptose:LPS heptosyltransferase
MTSKVYIHDGGGVGDIIRNHLTKKRGWGYIEALKKKYPNIELRVFITCCNPQGMEFVKYNPYIDLLEQHPWTHPHMPWPKEVELTRGYRPIEKVAKELLPGMKPIIPPVYLSEEDKKVVQEIKSQGKYVFIHPYSGESFRVVFPPKEYPALIDRLIDDLDYNVVIVGGSYLREKPGRSWSKKEEFKYERSGLFNLVNKSNVRVCAKLARDAYGWIGTFSCYARSGWHGNTRTVMFFPKIPPQPNGPDPNGRNLLVRIPPKSSSFGKYADRAIEHLKG